MNERSIIVQIQLALYLLLWASIIGSIRAMTSICAGLIFLLGVFTYRKELPNLFRDRLVNIFLLSSALLFTLDIISLLFIPQPAAAWDGIRIKSGLVLIPLGIVFSKDLIREYGQKLMAVFSILLAGAALYCLSLAWKDFIHTSDGSVFFYHKLASPLRQHAVFLSVIVFVALVFLSELYKGGKHIFTRPFHICLSLFLFFFLFLLSSKLVIAAFLVYLFFYLLSYSKYSYRSRWVAGTAVVILIVAASLAFTNKNSVSKRFYEIAKGDLKMVNKTEFNPAIYFNGLQFRLLEWRFVSTILKENNAWFKGVGTGNAQNLLDQKYISTRMYTGDPERKDRGFLGYNTHNQFLQTLLQNGVPGLLILLVLVCTLVSMAWKKKKAGLVFLTGLLLLWLLTESVFESQYSLFIFSFFPLFLYEDW